MAEKPAVKDISINLTNAPRELMLGTKSYDLNFMIMNLRSEQRDISVEFSSDAMSVEPAVSEITLAPQEKQTITLNVTPQKDGALDLSVQINLKKTIKYTETVLEGEEGAPAEPVVTRITSPAAPAEINESSPETETQPSAPVKPIKPGTAKPVKPAGAVKPVKQVGVTKPAVAKPMKPAGTAKPMKPVGTAKPMKPAGTAKPMKPVKPVKPAAAEQPVAEEKPSADNEALERKIMEIKDQYMSARGQLQSLKQGSPEYVAKYKEATRLKEQYEKLKGIYESGGTLADAGFAPKDPVEELKELMQKYNALKAQLKNLKPGNPAYEKMKQDALAVYKEYTEKHDKAKQEGLVS